jgi:hypothetical protein
MTQHLGVLGKGFWLGEESTLVKNTYINMKDPLHADLDEKSFSPMMAILDLYFMNPQSQ